MTAPLYERGQRTTPSYLDKSQHALAVVPGATALILTPVSPMQLSSAHQIVATLGNSLAVAQQLAPQSAYAIEEKAQQLKARARELEPVVSPVLGNRAMPFVAYLEKVGERGGSFAAIAAKVRRNEYAAQDVSQLIGIFYSHFAQGVQRRLKPNELNGQLNERELKEALKAFIAGGELGQRLWELLKTVVDARFNAVPEYLSLAAQLRDLNPDAAVSELESAVEGFKTGKASTPQIFGQPFNLEQALESSYGRRLGRYFIRTIGEMFDGEANDGKGASQPLAPFTFKASSGISGVPEELRQHYRPVAWLSKLVTLFDVTLNAMIAAYVSKNEELHSILHEVDSRRGVTFDQGLFMRAIFPSNNKPIMALYPDVRIALKGEEEAAQRCVRLIQEGRASIPKAVEQHFGVPESHVRFEELVQMQAELMQLLPMQLYSSAALKWIISRSSALPMRLTLREASSLTLEDVKIYAKKHLSKHGSAQVQQIRALLVQYESLEAQLTKDFAVNVAAATTITEETLRDSAELFGMQLGFVREALAKRANAEQQP